MTLQAHRLAAGLTVMELAKLSGLKPSALSELEHGRRPPTEGEAFELAIQLRTTTTAIKQAAEKSRQEVAKVEALLQSIDSGAPLPAGAVVISCTRGKGCQVRRG